VWAELWKETGRWKSQWKIRDLLADGWCSHMGTSDSVCLPLPLIIDDCNWKNTKRRDKAQRRTILNNPIKTAPPPRGEIVKIEGVGSGGRSKLYIYFKLIITHSDLNRSW